MKKQLIIISVLVIIISIFVSCSANSSAENAADGAIPIPTTAVTDNNGTTHYYQPVTDDTGNISTTNKNQGVFAKIETQSNGKAVTKKDGAYVTNEHTTILLIENITDNSIRTTKPSTEKSSSDNTKDIDDADNVVEFEPTETAEKTKPDTTTTTEKGTTNTTTETTTQKETQPATDKDGWITKWY